MQVAKRWKILIAGRLDSFNNQATNQIIRINGDGTFDNTFNTGIGLSQTGQINCIGFTNDNKILIVGSFTSYNNNPTPGIARLLDNGSFDSTFNVGNGIGGFGQRSYSWQ